MVRNNTYGMFRIMASVMILVMCFAASYFSYARAYNTLPLGANVSSATAIVDTVNAMVTDGEENFFKIDSLHLPATVYYLPDSAFGPIPTLVSAINGDTLPAVITVEDCRMGWKWELPAASENEEFRYLYFSSHETATAEICPTMCRPVHIYARGIEVCDEYEWEGKGAVADTTIVTSGTYTRVFQSVGGCDSVITQQITIHQSGGNQEEKITAYDSYTWKNGHTYNQSISGPGWEETTPEGCSLFLTLNLTIRHLVKDTVRAAVCPNELPYSWRGNTYTQSGLVNTDTIPGAAVDQVYMDTVHTLDLTVNESYAVDTTADILAVEYTWRGTTYTQSGNYPYYGHTAAGCDSIVTLHLTLTDPTPVDTVLAYFCPKSGIVEYVDMTSKPRIHYVPFEYEKPSSELYMEGVITDAASNGANVNFTLVETNLDAYYQAPLMPVTAIYWRYQKRGESSLSSLTPNAQQPQWIATGTVSMEVHFQCGQRYYDSFTVGDMTEGMEQMQEEDQPIKRIENGQVVIIRNGAKYSVLGTRIE